MISTPKHKAMGPDAIHPHILKELSFELSPVITHFFQQSIDNGIIPNDWKDANICPLFKKNDRTTPSNYRPVSLTCILCKLLEHIISSSLMTHFENNNIINVKQHAFRKDHSCETQLVNVIDDWAAALDKTKQTDVFILDFEKAFDTVPHELLKSKLHGFGVNKSVMNWIDSFLSKRQQCVVVNGSKSTYEDVASGVPQGTVLGPILFLAHINDIADDVSSEVRLFADDCVCYREIKTTDDCEKMQKDIDTLGQWAEKWGMRFQPVKCNVMRLSRKKKNIEFKYTLKGTELELLSSIKYLGVTITNNLHWEKHINDICNKAYRTLGLLRRNLSACSRDVKLQAYKGLMRPVLEYACTAWDPGEDYLQKRLEKVQNQAARFIASNYQYTPGSMTSILEQLELEPLKERREQIRLKLFCKGVYKRAAIPIDQLKRPKLKLKTMHNQHFMVPFARTNVHKNSFMPKTTRDWNHLPSDIISRMESSDNPPKTFSEIVKGGVQ